MINNTVSTAIILDTRRAKKDGTFPLKLRLTFHRKQKYYGTGLSLTAEDYDKVMGDRPRNDYKQLRLQLTSIEEKAWEVIRNLSPFSFQAFEKQYNSKKHDIRDVFAAFQAYIDKLDADGRAGTAYSYSASLTSFKAFVSRKKLPFDEITVEFLEGYEKWMLNQDKTLTTVGIYLRNLRAIYNQAIRESVVPQAQYPFGKHKYQIPAGRNVKKALTMEEIEKIFSYPAPKGSTEERSRDLWMFSYFCNGINLKDIALLKYKNVEGDMLSFIRAKTERTNRQNQKAITAFLTPQAKAIIKQWGNKPAKPDTYIFPILEKGISPQRELSLIRQATKTVNKYMKRIAADVGIEKNVTTYSARHSFSTVLKRSGASIAFISESLGHSDLKTTENYLDSFEDKMKREYANLLIPKSDKEV